MDKNMVKEMQNLVKRIGDLVPGFTECIKEIKKTLGVLELSESPMEKRWKAKNNGNIVDMHHGLVAWAGSYTAASVIVEAHNATLEPDTPEPEWNILDEDWYPAGNPDSDIPLTVRVHDPEEPTGKRRVCVVSTIWKKDGKVRVPDRVKASQTADAIAALPDVYRALVMVRDAYPLGDGDKGQVEDALSKALRGVGF